MDKLIRTITLRFGLTLAVLLSLHSNGARADVTKTIEVVAGVQTIAVTTWYYANCNTSLGVGSYSVNVAPTHGNVTSAVVSGPLPGCPAGSPSLPAVQAYYTWTDTSSSATSDFFQLYYILNGQVTQVEDVTVTLALPSAPPPKILFNGIDTSTLTQPIPVVIGQQIALTSVVTPPSGTAVESQQWTIPGAGANPATAIASYSAGAEGETITPITAADLSETAVTFHWIVPGESFQVTYSYTASNGQTAAASASFSVAGVSTATGATALASAQIGTVNIVNQYGAPRLLLSGLSYYLTNVGIIFTSHIEPPTGIKGSVEWIELVNNTTYTAKAPTYTKTCTNVGFDNIYGSIDLFGFPVSRTSFGDAPGALLSEPYLSVSDAQSITAYLLWHPDLDSTLGPSVPVPLGHITFKFQGTAVNSSGTWSIVSGSSESADLFVPDNSYPKQWTTIAKTTGRTCTKSP